MLVFVPKKTKTYFGRMRCFLKRTFWTFATSPLWYWASSFRGSLLMEIRLLLGRMKRNMAEGCQGPPRWWRARATHVKALVVQSLVQGRSITVIEGRSLPLIGRVSMSCVRNGWILVCLTVLNCPCTTCAERRLLKAEPD